jgi:hypothetical protein
VQPIADNNGYQFTDHMSRANFALPPEAAGELDASSNYTVAQRDFLYDDFPGLCIDMCDVGMVAPSADVVGRARPCRQIEGLSVNQNP